MHVKDLAARYEAVAARKVEASAMEDTVQAETVGNGRVKELAVRLERAVREKESDWEKDEMRKKELRKSESPRAVEAVEFEAARGLETIVPVSVADTGENDGEEGKSVEEKVAWFEKGSGEKKRIDDEKGYSVKFKNKITVGPDVMAERAALESPYTVVDKKLLGGDYEERSLNLEVDRSGQSSSWGSKAKSDSGYDSEAFLVAQSGLRHIQLVEDVSDDDLDNIDGIKYVEDFDSHEDCEDDLHRQKTTEILDDHTSPACSQRELLSNDIEHNGCHAPLIHVEDTNLDKPQAGGKMTENNERIVFVDTISGGMATSFNSKRVFDEESVTSVEELDNEGRKDKFKSAREVFLHTSPPLLESKASSRRPRVKSIGMSSEASSGIGKVSPVSTEESLKSGRSGLASAKLSQNTGIGKEFMRSTDRMLPVSMRRLPKAKVVIARRRGQSMDLRRLESDEEQPRAHATMSMDDRGVRQLVRDCTNPTQLLTRQVSLVDVVIDGDEKKMEGNADVGAGMGMTRRHRREDELKKKYDEFLDAEELGRHHLSGRNGEDEDRDLTAEEKMGSSKHRYKNRVRLFGKSGVKDRDKLRLERQKRHAENVQRRSSILSGALDRVSMAADPWIDFITDANTLPGGKRPFRGVMKKLFRRGRGNDLIKS